MKCEENKGLLGSDLYTAVVFDGSTTGKVTVYKDVQHWHGDNQL